MALRIPLKTAITTTKIIVGEIKVYQVAAAYPRLQGYWETGHVPGAPGSWDLRYPLPKTEKSADLARYFSGVAKFCV